MTQAANLAAVLKSAIVSHQQWKRRLLTAIETGNGTFSAETVSRDDQCEFGRALADGLQELPHVAKLREIHRQFHAEAGRLLRLAHERRQPEARLALKDGALYHRLENDLLAMLNRLAAEVV